MFTGDLDCNLAKLLMSGTLKCFHSEFFKLVLFVQSKLKAQGFLLFFSSVGLCRTSSPWTRSPFFSPPKSIDLISCRLMQDGGTLVKTLCRPTLRRHKATWRVGKSEGEPRTRHGEVNKQGVRQPEDKAGCTIISTLLLLFF